MHWDWETWRYIHVEYMYFYIVKISSIFFLASECWTLSRFLPLLIGDLVPEDDNHWQLFLLLLKIIKWVTAAVNIIFLWISSCDSVLREEWQRLMHFRTFMYIYATV